MIVGSRSWRALMRRNFIYLKRNWIGTIFELLLPVAFVGILVAIKNSVQKTSSFAPQTIPATYPDYSFTPLTFADYVTGMEAQRYCIEAESDYDNDVTTSIYNITGILYQGDNWQIPFVKCDSRKCTSHNQNARPFCEYGSIAVSASSAEDIGGKERAVDFRQYIYDSYPATQNMSSILGFDNTSNNNNDKSLYEFVLTFDSPRGMDEYVQSSYYGSNMSYPKIVMGVVFDGNSSMDYKYSLRQNSTNFNAPEWDMGRPATRTTPDTNNQLLNSYAKTDWESCPYVAGSPYLGVLESSCTGQYMYNGVLTFTRLVGDYILHRSQQSAAGNTTNGTTTTTSSPYYFVAEGGVEYVQFPSKEYVENGFYATIKVYGPLLVALGLLYPVAAMISYISREKELRQKELMRMMSVTESDIGWSWFITFAALGLVTATATTPVSVKLYENSEPLYLWIFWILTCLAVIVYSLLVSTFTSKATRNILIGLLVFFIGVFLTLAVDYQTGSSSLIKLISLHPVAAFSYGLQEIGRLEDLGVGLQSSSIGTTDSSSGYTFNDTLSSLIIDSVLWGVVTFYLNRVIKPEYGQALPVWFPCKLSYWFPSRAKAPPPHEEDDDDSDEYQGIPYEPVSSALRRQREEGKNIEVHQLRKTFGDNIAVDGLNLSMYSGQITALLGHNGAGKTTTINCLTGAIAPTDGYATIFGKDIRTQMHQIRSDIGICLQHDCLFPMLTVREHVQFFSRIKGLYSTTSKDEAEGHVDQAIRDVALSEKSNTLSKNLSGGMKRKLSVAIAFCGGSKLVLLDEPTSGMDPFSRRFTWSVIRSFRQDRCIILTTHHMDEADILGDRIAIMAEGSLRCQGSSLFLKKEYGVGYNLTIDKLKSTKLGPDVSNNGSSSKENTSKTESPTLKANDDNLKDIVTGAVKEATILSNVGSEMSFRLPVGASSEFAPMFEGLDTEVERGTISSYGMSITTLDEVFLLVARRDATTDHEEFTSASPTSRSLAEEASEDQPDTEAPARMDLDNEHLFLTHLGTLVEKRAAIFRRDKRSWVFTSILPSLFVLVGFILFKFASQTQDLGPIPLNLSDYNSMVTTNPQNPIPFNSPDEVPFTCQPSVCAYEQPIVFNPQYNELYYFCGYKGRFLDNHNCSISESAAIVSRIADDGVSAEATIVGDVSDASRSLSATASSYAASQYGALFFTHDSSSTLDDGTSYNSTVVETCESRPGVYTSSSNCDVFGGVGYLIQYNFTAPHVAPLYQTLADEALVREALDTNEFNIQCTIDPLPITEVETKLISSENAYSAWFLVVLSFPFIAGAFATFVVSERQSKAKHLQTVAGVEPSAYWISSYLWDLANYQIPLWTTVILMFAFDVEVLTTTKNDVLSGVIVLLFLYGPAAAGFSYCVSFAFTSAAVCNVFVIIFGFLVGMGGPIATFILLLLGNDPYNRQQNLINASKILTWILRFVPTFNLGNGLFRVINITAISGVEGKAVSAWSESVLLYEVIFLAWESVVYLVLAIQLDKWSTNPRLLSYWQNFMRFLACQCFFKSKDASEGGVTLPDDDDVLAEQNRVLNGDADSNLISLKELTKIYDNPWKLAVDNVSFGIPPGECFGLLGINGAGKTTTMAMLTAEFPPTSGDAILAGFSVRNEPEKTRRRIGYCPQFDAHFSNMTGREHVELYASIKGVPKGLIKSAAAEKLREVGLSKKDFDRLSSGYSGGMKRRLSLAIATIGHPQIVFLDECTTGVDPVARREIWKLISDMVTGDNIPKEERTSVILTTHSMEECEALCPRIGIMANGRLRCLGSAQHLKNKFGQGYQIEMKVKLVDRQDTDYVANALALHSRLTGVTCDEEALSIPEDDPDADKDSFFTSVDAVKDALQALTGDDSLSNMVADENPSGYTVWKDATSAFGATHDEVAAFCTIELRMKNVEKFMQDSFPNNQHVLRERQDSKVRYEVSSDNNDGTGRIRLASIFANIEAAKERLHLADYSISQTSLEQVFNMHAAEAEKHKAS